VFAARREAGIEMDCCLVKGERREGGREGGLS